MLKVVKRLLDTGVSLQQIREAIKKLRDRGVEDLAQITLMSDGASVYECTSADEVYRPAAGWPGRLRHRRGPGLAEVEGTLAALPSERPEDEVPAAHPDDELSARRAQRIS